MDSDYKRQITEELKDIPEEDLSRIYEFIHWIKFKIVKGEQKQNIIDQKEDPLSKAIGCCEAPDDLSDKHDFYLYGKDRK